MGPFTGILKLRAVVIDGRDITALTAHGKRQRIGGASINDIRVIVSGDSKCCGCHASQKRQQESAIRSGQHGSWLNGELVINKGEALSRSNGLSGLFIPRYPRPHSEGLDV